MNVNNLFSSAALRRGLLIFIAILLFVRLGYSQLQMTKDKEAVLQGYIQMEPVKPIAGDDTAKVQPGTPVKLVVMVENKGSAPSPAGQLYLRYVFAKPLDAEATSLIFETEKEPLPSIAPGGKIDVAFTTTHQTPSLLDFVRYDWSLREYQAIARFDETEKVIGTLAITFSAYYYPGIHKEMPTKILLKD